MMRKEFQKLAAELLVEATTPQEPPEEPPAIITVDRGNAEERFYVSAENVDATVQAIDAAGDSTKERISALDQASSGVITKISDWLNECFGGSPAQLAQAKSIFETEFLKDPTCIQLFGKYANLSNPSPRKSYEEKHRLILKLAQFVPPPRGGRLGETTGPGEFAIGYLFAKAPARAPSYDFQIGGVQYTVKHQASDKKLGTFVYKFSSASKVALATHYAEKIKDMDPKTTQPVFNTALTNLGYDPSKSNAPEKLSKSQVAALILDLKRPNRSTAFVAESGETRWALVCNLSPEVFTFRAFSISARLDQLHREEIAASKGREPIYTDKINITNTTISIKLESKSKSSRLISELSRRDQQDVEAIARRVAQEVLEDELGDDFDKAVRREMISSFKDKDVESGVADISRDFMRKFYRSLGTASSSPLDKVKV